MYGICDFYFTIALKLVCHHLFRIGNKREDVAKDNNPEIKYYMRVFELTSKSLKVKEFIEFSS